MNIDSSTLEFLKGVQRGFAKKISLAHLNHFSRVCGVDVSYRDDGAVAAAVVRGFGTEVNAEVAYAEGDPTFPYIPGLFFLREGPLMTEAIGKLKTQPDLILVDGHGLAHPRRAGLAVFVGVLLNIPTIGMAKRLLVGEIGEDERIFQIKLNQNLVGYGFRSKEGKRYYLSPGNRVSIENCRELIELMHFEYPDVLATAHKLSKDRVQGKCSE